MIAFLTYSLFVLLLESYSFSSGTLVILIPTKDGIVAAADSRTTVLGKHYDNMKKLHVVPKINMFYTITGTSSFLTKAPSAFITEDWIRNTPLDFDGEKIVEDFLFSSQTKVLNKTYLSKIAGIYVDSLKKFFIEYPGALTKFKEDSICRVVLAQYLSKKKLSIVGTFTVTVSSEWKIQPKLDKIEYYKVANPVIYRSYGESEYLDAIVFNGEGRKLLSKKFWAIIEKAKTIGNLMIDDGAYLAYSIISVTSKMTEKIPPPSGIGGKINIIILNNKLKNGFKKLEFDKDFHE